jgi:hypothetical protein
MGQQQALANNNITPNKTLVSTSPNEEKNLHTVVMRRPLALNGLSKRSKHNLENTVETEFNDHFAWPMTSKRLLFTFSNLNHTTWGNTSPTT